MEKLPSIALGTWSWGTGFAGGDRVFGNNLGVEELKPVFDEAMANGLNLWDSAVVYGMRVSETVLSTFTKNCKREDVFISTKFTPQIAGDSENPVADPLLLIGSTNLQLHQVWAFPNTAMVAILLTKRAFVFPVLQVI